MIFASPSPADDGAMPSPFQKRRSTRVTWARWILLLALFATVYGYGVNIRLIEWPLWATSNLCIQGEWLLPTNDAYFELTAADGQRTLQEASVMARGLAVVHSLTGIPLGTLGFWAPLAIAPLAALPVVMLLWSWGSVAGALLAGFFITSAPGFLARTRLGFFDTDLVNLLFPLLLASLAAGWLSHNRPYALTKVFVKDTLHPVLDPCADVSPQTLYQYNSGAWAATRLDALFRVDMPCFLSAAWLIGLIGWCWVALYPSGKLIAFAIVGTGFPALLWTQRNRLTPALVGFGIMLGALFAPLYAGIGLLVAIALTQLPRARSVCDAIPRKAIWLLCALLLAGVAWLLWPKLISHLTSYGLIDTPFGEATVQAGINVPNSYAMVNEVQRPALNNSWIFFSVHNYLTFAALAGTIIALLMRPVLIVFIPLMGLGLSIAWLGARFSLYGAALGLGLGMAIACIEGDYTLDWKRFTMRYKIWRSTRWVVAWALSLTGCWFMVVQVHAMLKTVGANAILSSALVRELPKLDAILPAGAVLWCWWDHGFNMQYFARRHSITDSHHNGFDSIYLPGLVMSSDNPLLSSRVMQYSAQHMTPAPTKSSVPQHVSYHNGAMATLLAMGHEKAEALLQTLASQPLPSRAGTPEQFMVVSWEGLQHIYHMAAVGKWNLRTGGSPKYYLIDMDNITEHHVNGNTVTFTPYPPQELDGFAILEKDGSVNHTKLQAGNQLYAIWNKNTGKAYLLHKHMYESTYIRLLLWDKTTPLPGFTLTHDASPVMRVFKSVGE